MKKLVLPLLLLLMLFSAASAECPVSLADPLAGEYFWPEGSTAEEALYVYRYSYPQLAGDGDVALHVNTTYAYSVEDALAFEIPMLASDMQPGDPQKVVEIGYTVTAATADYLSIRLDKRVTVAGESTEVVTGHVIALTGSGAGSVINLPVFTGLLDAEETDEWLLTRQTNKADKVVRDMVWQRIQEELASPHPTFHFYDDLTFEELEASFYPEEDFWLTEAGDPCFYFQPGVIAPEEEGVPTFVIPLWELMDEL